MTYELIGIVIGIIAVIFAHHYYLYGIRLLQIECDRIDEEVAKIWDRVLAGEQNYRCMKRKMKPSEDKVSNQYETS